MISITSKNLSCLRLNPNSFLCNSNVDYFFSTSRVRRLIPRPEIYDVLVHKHQFSPELSSVAASHLAKSISPERVNSILSLFKENSFTSTQLEKLIIYNSQFLGYDIEGIQIKFKVFQDLGLSSEEIAKIITSNQAILYSSTTNRIIPSLSMLKKLLGSNEDVAKLLRISSWYALADIEQNLLPNIEILKSYGIPMKRIIHFLYKRPRCLLLKPNIMRKSVDKAIELGVSTNSMAFIYAACVFSYTSEGMWEVKFQNLRDLGFSDTDILNMFRRAPTSFAVSVEKIKKVVELLLDTGKYNISSIVSNPSSLGCSIERRLEPRLQILGVLESRNRIQNWPGLASLYQLTDVKFFDKFVGPYYDEIGNEYAAKIWGEGKQK